MIHDSGYVRLQAQIAYLPNQSSCPTQTSKDTSGPRRIKRDVLFPPDLVDTIDPYLLNSHQGFLEQVLLDDLLERGLEVHRKITFVDYRIDPAAPQRPIEVVCESDITREKLTYHTKYLVGCDGAASNVRKCMPGSRQTGSSNASEIWGVIDGTLDTNFPDIYSKTVVHSREAGTIVLFPRERNMTRIYVELKSDYLTESQSKLELTQIYVMDRISEVLEVSLPYNLNIRLII
jgi:phenol 2-monooxygenase (NADPH)